MRRPQNTLPLVVLLCALMATPGCDDDTLPGADARVLADAKMSDRAAPDMAPDALAASPDRGTASPDQQAPVADKGQPGPDQGGPTADGAIPYFPKVLDGLWLIGWSVGSKHHYSWVKFEVTRPSGGKAWILDGKGMTANTPVLSCAGQTSWNLASRINTVQLQFPSSACTGARSGTYTFSSFKQPGVFPRGAILRADLTGSGLTGSAAAGFKFPVAQCNATVTTCKDPLAP